MPSNIGRVGRGVVQLDAIENWNLSGSGRAGKKVQLHGLLHPATQLGFAPTDTQLAQVFAERQRLIALVDNPEESVVPIHWDCEEFNVGPNPTLGYYRITDVDVSYRGPSAATGILDFNVSAEQVQGYAAPQFEAVITGASVANPHGLVGVSWFSFPEVSKYHHYSDLCSTNVLRVSATGTLNFTDCNSIFSGSLKYYLTPDDFYTGECTLEMGNPLELKLGMQVEDSPANWIIDNGLVRISPGTVIGTFDIQHYDGTQWETAKTYVIAGTEPANPPTSPKQAGLITELSALTVFRNAPETVIIRLSCVTQFGVTLGRLDIDIKLRQGDRNVIFSFSTDADQQFAIRRATAEAATAITGGIRATSNDADGNRYVISTSSAFTSDLAQGEVRLVAAAGTAYFMVSSEIGGSGAVSSAQAVELVKQFHGGQSIRLLVAAR